MSYKWHPSKAAAREFSEKMDEIASFCVEHGISHSASMDSFYFRVNGEDYRVSNMSEKGELDELWEGKGWYYLGYTEETQQGDALWFEDKGEMVEELASWAFPEGQGIHPYADFQGTLMAPLDRCEGFLASREDAEVAVRKALGRSAEGYDVEAIAEAYYDFHDDDLGWYAINTKGEYLEGQHDFWDVAETYHLSHAYRVVVEEPDRGLPDVVVHVMLFDDECSLDPLVDCRNLWVRYGTPDDIERVVLAGHGVLANGTSIDGTIVALLAANDLTADDVTFENHVLPPEHRKRLAELVKGRASAPPTEEVVAALCEADARQGHTVDEGETRSRGR